MRAVTVISAVRADRAALWARIAGFAGVNDELAPWFRMTAPAGSVTLSADLATGTPLFRSWLLLFGVVPVEFDLIGFERIVVGAGFAERSRMGLLAPWWHDRWLDDVPGGTRITDRLRFGARLPGGDALAAPIVRALFRHRHRRLARRFGALAPILAD
jgi:hypothetical protein